MGIARRRGLPSNRRFLVIPKGPRDVDCCSPLAWLDGQTLRRDQKLAIAPEGATKNPVPGGMTVTQDGKRLTDALVDGVRRNVKLRSDLF